ARRPRGGWRSPESRQSDRACKGDRPLSNGPRPRQATQRGACARPHGETARIRRESLLGFPVVLGAGPARDGWPSTIWRSCSGLRSLSPFFARAPAGNRPDPTLAPARSLAKAGVDLVRVLVRRRV